MDRAEWRARKDYRLALATAKSVNVAGTAVVLAVFRLVYVPDAAGSVCFLVASGLAWFEVSHGWWSWNLRGLSWRVAALNLAASIAFGMSAVASKIVPTTGEPRSILLVNLGTAVGGVCFLVGALLLLPERTLPRRAPVPSATMH